MIGATGLVSTPAVLEAFAHARSITLSAYTLAPGGAVTRALEAAGDRGAAVSVTLQNFGMGRERDTEDRLDTGGALDTKGRLDSEGRLDAEGGLDTEGRLDAEGLLAQDGRLAADGRPPADARREPEGWLEPEGLPRSDDLRRYTARVAAELRQHGVVVKLGVPSGAEVHLKAAVADGIAFLADRNWTSTSETVLATTQTDDVAAVRAAIDGRFVATADLATEKRAALALEAETIRSGTGDRVDLESESFGACGVCAALRRRAETGARVRLLVSGRIAFASTSGTERAVLGGLAKSGIEIRTTEANEKLCIAGAAGWVGSANATYEYAPTSDWGYEFRNSPVIAHLESTFEHSWKTARPFRL